MSEKVPEKPTPTVMPVTPDKPALNEQHIGFLMQEIDRMQTFYLQTQSGAQGIFNFYLTLITAVLGAVLVLLQVAPSGTNALSAKLILMGILCFIAFIGLIYLSSISGRYGDMVRYARAVDTLRLYLITELNVPLPPMYTSFVNAGPYTESKTPYVWILPSGTYEFFVAIVNSASLAGIVILLATIGNTSGILAAVVVFFLTFSVQNAFSHLMIRVPNRNLSVQIDTSQSLAFSSGRQ